MESLTILNPDEFRSFLLIFMRVSVVLFLIPIFGNPMLPNLAKAGFSLIVTFLLFSVLKVDPALFPGNGVETGMMIFCEVMVGVTLGLSVRIFLAGIQMAGELIGFQMGFSMISVIDPQSGSNVSIIDQIGYWVVLVIFLLLDGHHIIFSALADSFRIAPPGLFMLKAGLLKQMIHLTAEMFVVGIKITAPCLASLLFVDVAFGIMAKFAPTMNVMMVAFPIKIATGLLIFAFSLKIILLITRGYLSHFYEQLASLLVLIAGG